MRRGVAGVRGRSAEECGEKGRWAASERVLQVSVTRGTVGKLKKRAGTKCYVEG